MSRFFLLLTKHEVFLLLLMTGIVLGALGGCLILGVGVGWWDVVVGSLKREIMFCYEFLAFAFIFLHLSWVYYELFCVDYGWE